MELYIKQSESDICMDSATGSPGTTYYNSVRVHINFQIRAPKYGAPCLVEQEFHTPCQNWDPTLPTDTGPYMIREFSTLKFCSQGFTQ